MDPFDPPRATLIPGRPGGPGSFHFMLNAFAYVHDQGLGGYRITNPTVGGHAGGRAEPVVSGDWLMGAYRASSGWFEALLMLNLEPLTVGHSGVAQLGQSGEGLLDAQHSHLFLHQAMVAFHPLAATVGGRATMEREPDYDLAIFVGQGGATIGPPIFMHRPSSPGPTVPRKHHKGENPHETFPVFGVSLRWHGTWLEASLFGAQGLGPSDSRWRPHPAAPESFALRLRQDLGRWLELQISGERLAAQGRPAPEIQLSASALGYWQPGGWRVDALLDWAVDLGDGDSAHAALVELALRTPSRAQTVWLRTELNEREEPDDTVSSPWLFQTLGFEQVLLGDPRDGLRLGLFGEVTYGAIPEAMEDLYGQGEAASIAVGLHLTGMWMLDTHAGAMKH